MSCCSLFRGRILGRIRDKSFRVFLLAIHDPPPSPPNKSGLKLVCNVNHCVYGNLKSENSQDYAQKPQRNCTFMNSASGRVFSIVYSYVIKRSSYVLRVLLLLYSPQRIISPIYVFFIVQCFSQCPLILIYRCSEYCIMYFFLFTSVLYLFRPFFFVLSVTVG